MKGKLINILYQYIRENNPDVLMELEETGSVTKYLGDKVSSADELLEQLRIKAMPTYIVEELCMNFLTEDLKPSKYNYICNILESEFELKFNEFIGSGLLKYEIRNLIKYCQSVFDDLNFSVENEENKFLSYAITGVIKEYLDNVASENLPVGRQV